jgi:hypothetical protein
MIFEIPNNKFQFPNKFQILNSKHYNMRFDFCENRMGLREEKTFSLTPILLASYTSFEIKQRSLKHHQV